LVEHFSNTTYIQIFNRRTETGIDILSQVVPFHSC